MSIQALRADGSTVTYTDRRRWLWSLSLLWPLLPVVGCLLASISRACCVVLDDVVVWYAVVPLIDHLLPPDSSNPPPEVMAQLEMTCTTAS